MKIGQKFYLSLLGLLIIVLIILAKNRADRKSQYWLIQKDISSFEVGNLKLNKVAGEKWFVENEPADKEDVDSFLKGLRQLTVDKLISENTERFSAFGINSDSVVVKISSKTITLGRLGSRYETTYVKFSDKAGVYEVSEIWGNGEIAKLNYWRSKFVTNLPVFQVSRVELDKNIFVPTDGKWENPAWINTVCYLRANSYLGQTEPKSQKKYIYKISLENDMAVLTIGVDMDRYWAGNGKDYYEISKDDFSLLTSVAK